MQLEKLENQHAEVNEAGSIPTSKLASMVRQSRPNEEQRSVNKSLPSPRKHLGPLSATKELAQFDINNGTLRNEYQSKTREIRGGLHQDHNQEDQTYADEFHGGIVRPNDLPLAATEAENLGELAGEDVDED